MALFQPVADFTIAPRLGARGWKNGALRGAPPGADRAGRARHDRRPRRSASPARPGGRSGPARPLGAGPRPRGRRDRKEAAGAPSDALGLLPLARTSPPASPARSRAASRDPARAATSRSIRASGRTRASGRSSTSRRTPSRRSPRTGYGASAADIAWAVLDTGINPDHPHFAKHKNWRRRWDCTAAQLDREGRGGSTATATARTWPASSPAVGDCRRRRTDARVCRAWRPRPKLHVYKVLDDNGNGEDAGSSRRWTTSPTPTRRRTLGHPRREPEPGRRRSTRACSAAGTRRSAASCGGCGAREWWSCIAAGQRGLRACCRRREGDASTPTWTSRSATRPTSTRRSPSARCTRTNPHTYGISYFSSRGPTADGRTQARPASRRASASSRADTDGDRGAGRRRRGRPLHRDERHQHGGAARLGRRWPRSCRARREFIGYPDRVKRILLDNCTDLGRDAHMQGARHAEPDEDAGEHLVEAASWQDISRAGVD